MLCACRCSMPRAAPQHMAATCAHVISSAGECSIPYSDPLHPQQICLAFTFSHLLLTANRGVFHGPDHGIGLQLCLRCQVQCTEGSVGSTGGLTWGSTA